MTAPAWGIADYELTPFSEIGLTLNGQGSMTGTRQSNWDIEGARYQDRSVSGSGLNLGLDLNHEIVNKAYEYSLEVPLVVDWTDDKKTQTASRPSGGANAYDEDDSAAYTLDASLAIRPEFIWYPGMFQLGARPSLGGFFGNRYVGTKTIERAEYFDGTPNDYIDTRETDWLEQQQATAGLSFWAGVGRADSCVSAWRALKLAGELRRRGCLARPLSPADAQALAGLLANAYSAFAWDAREKRFTEAMAITRFLEERGYLTDEAAASSLTVSEALDYGGGMRYRGWEAVAFGDMQGKWVNAKYEDQPLLSTHEDNWMYGVRGGYYLPFAEDWQLDASGEVRKYDRAERWQLTSSQGLSWYPDTRLSVALNNYAGWATHHEAGPGYGGDQREWFDRGRLVLGWTMTRYVVVNLSGYLAYYRRDYINTYTDRFAQSAAATSIRDVHDKNSYSDEWERGLDLSFTYRFF